MSTRSARLKAKLAELLKDAQTIIKTAEDRENKDLTKEEVEKLENLNSEIERLQKELETVEKSEKLAAAADAVPAATTVERGAGDRVPAQVKDAKEATKQVSLVGAAALKSKLTGEHPIKILEDEGYGRFAEELKATNGMAGKSVNTLTPAAGGVLMPAPARGQLMDMLTPVTTFLAGNPMRVPLAGGRYEEPYGVSGAVASYVGEGVKKPVSDVTFDKFSLKAKKLAGIVLITKEARKWTIPQIEAYIERNLGNACSQALDVAGYLGTGVGDVPLGILNVVGIGSYASVAAAPKAPTLPEIDAMATKAITHMSTRNVVMRAGAIKWVMATRTIEFLKNIRVGAANDGVFAFPDLQGDNPRWKGYPVLVSNNIPTNLGAGTDETIIALVNFDDVLFGEEEGLSVDVSTEATVALADSTLIHLWQQNMYGILAEMEHDFGVRNKASVVKLTGIRWGAP